MKPSQHKHILCVDDDALLRRYLGAFLEQAGWNVTLAGDGVEALEQYRAGKFDIVLTDFNMPRMNGGQLAKAVKSMDETQPVIMLTGSDYAVLGRSPLEAVNLLLAKPVSAEELIDAIGTVLAKS